MDTAAVEAPGGGPAVAEDSGVPFANLLEVASSRAEKRTAGGSHERMKAWEPEEDLIILQMVSQGLKWGVIAKELPDRTVASVRNRWQRIEKGRKANANHPALIRTNTKFANTVVGGGGKRDPKRFSARFRSNVPGALDDVELESFLILDPGEHVDALDIDGVRELLTSRSFAWVDGGGTACCGFTRSKPREGAAARKDGGDATGDTDKANPQCGPGEARQGRWRHKDSEIIELHPCPTEVTSKGFAAKPSDKSTWRRFRLVVCPTSHEAHPGAFWLSRPFWIIPDATLAKMSGPPPETVLPPLAHGPWRPGQEAMEGNGTATSGVPALAVAHEETLAAGGAGGGLDLLLSVSRMDHLADGAAAGDGAMTDSAEPAAAGSQLTV